MDDIFFFDLPDFEIEQHSALGSRTAALLFRKLDVSKATGSGKISAAILKRLADYLAMPLIAVCRCRF